MKLKRVMVGGIFSLTAFGLLMYLLGEARMRPALAQEDAQEQPKPEPAPPAGQTYIGTKKCASCHFEQYLKWRKTPHAKAFDVLTAKYQTDAKCLKCHTTGFGHATGFKDASSTSSLVGVSCEVCHGPGSKHEEVSKPFANVKELTAEQEAMLRDSIWKLLPHNVCIECHKAQAHGESQTPPELRKD